MDSANCETEAGIKEYLRGGLRGLHELIQARMTAAKLEPGVIHFARNGPKQGLDEFLLFGRILLDQFGQTWTVTEGYGDDENAHGILYVPDVLSVPLLEEVLPKLTYSRTIRRIAPYDMECRVCGAGWTLATATDVVAYQDEPAHPLCAKLFEEKGYQEQYRRILDRTPFGVFPVSYVQNGYWTTGLPWVRVKTPWGAIVMGWRKRVIDLDWTDTKCDVGNLFASEDVTMPIRLSPNAEVGYGRR